jgi:protein-disulfide isomerase
VSAWVPRVLIALAVIGLGYAIVSISVGEGGPQSGEIHGIDDVQRIYGGIAQDGAYLGPDDAEVTVTVFNDMQCSPCADFETETVDRLVEEYARTGRARLEFRHFSVGGTETTLAALAAVAAGAQSREWQYIDAFFRNQELAEKRGVTDELLRNVAEAVPQLDVDAWEEEFAEPSDEKDRVEEDADLATSLRLPAEPAVVVSGPSGQRQLIETPSYEEIVSAIDAVS